MRKHYIALCWAAVPVGTVVIEGILALTVGPEAAGFPTITMITSVGFYAIARSVLEDK